MLSLLEQAISKYSDGDSAYANKLKQHIRDGMGYSNYMSKLGKETAAPASIGDIKGLSPQGIRERMSSRFGMQNQNVNTLTNIAGAFDTAAGQIATDQISKARAAASARQNAMGFENGVLFQPKDQLDTDLLKTLQNPYNTDGSVKSLQQIQA